MDLEIIKTLSYFDIFDYPLTFAEIKKYLECEIEYTDDELYDILHSVAVVQEANGYYYLLGRREITEKRAERGTVSITKLAKARLVAKVLSLIPTIEYIGISGSLSMNNASSNDDIDLFFITKRNTLWLTRFVVNCLLVLIKQKRKKKTNSAKDKICPNMFMESSSLIFNRNKRNLYVAHEIVQLKTLYDRNQIYPYFLGKNKWLRDFLPNIQVQEYVKPNDGLFQKIALSFIKPFEQLAYIAQRLYMKPVKSGETVTNTKAFFHPLDRQKIILDMVDVRFDRYKRLFDDNVWVDTDEARFYMEDKKIRILN